MSTRDRLAGTLLDLFIEGVFKHGRFRADSNLGNYLVTPDARLALLDFGRVTRLPQSEFDFYHQLKARIRFPADKVTAVR